MKRFLLLATACVSLLSPFGAVAGELGSVAVVDVEKIFAKAKAVQDIREYYSAKDKEYKAMVKGFEAELMAKQKDLKAKEGDLTADEFALERNKLEKQVLESRNKLQALNKQASKSLLEAENKVRHEVMKIINDISTEADYDIVFPAQSLVRFKTEELDITAEALKRLNKALPKIDVKEE